jgi:hypothetical protein
VAAGYVIPFLLCPLNPRFPSGFLPVGMVLSDLKCTTGDIDRFVKQIQAGLKAAGFVHVVPTTAFDNPSVHRKYALLSGNPRGFPGDRGPGGSLGAELLNGEDAILTLGAFRRTGATIETVVTIDMAHTEKNSTLMPLHHPLTAADSRLLRDAHNDACCRASACGHARRRCERL